MADGSIRVSTKLDSKPAKADLEKFVQEFQKAEKKIEAAGAKIKTVFTGMGKGQLNSAFKTANRELEKTEKALAAVESKIAEIQAETDKALPQAATDDQAANLLALEEQQAAPLLKQRDELTAKAAEYKQQMEAITAELNKQTQAETAQNALKSGGKEAAADAAWISKIRTQEQYNAAVDTTRAKMAAIERQAEEISRETGVARDKLLQQDNEYQKLSRRLASLTSQTKKFGTAGAQAGKKTKSEMSKASKTMNGFVNSLKQGIKKAGKMALAVIGIRAAYNAVRRAADAYLQGNQALQQQLSSIWNIIGQAIGPVIEMMVRGISTVIIWINTLIKALTGVDLVAKANAAALKKQAGATKEAAKAAQLAGFDEINKLNDDGSSGGGGGGGAEIFDPSLAFDIPGFMKKIKEQILAGDWFGAGETLGTALMGGIESIDWYKVGYTIGDVLVSAAQFALGFLLQIDPMVLLESATGFVAGLFSAIAGGIQELDWQEIGKQIMDFVLFGLLATIGTTNPVLGFIMLMLTPNGDELASSAAELAGSILGALAAALVGAAKRVGEIASEVWTTIKTHFDKYVDWDDTPGNIISGLFEGIKAAIKGIGEWIKTNIWEPFKEGFCKSFGIASPAKEMEPLGKFIIEGLLKGFGDIWSKAKSIFEEFKTSVNTWFYNLGKDCKEWGVGVITKFKEGIGDIWSKISSKFTEAKNSIAEWGSGIKTKATEAGEKFVTGLTSGLNTVKSKLKGPINSLISMVETAINYIIGRMNNLSWSIPSWVPGVGGKKFGFSMSKISIPRLARGGIVNNPGRGVLATIGEAGTEAVLPLENNTDWMDILAEKINGGAAKIIVPIYLNGRKIAEEVIDLSNKRKFATNGAF